MSETNRYSETAMEIIKAVGCDYQVFTGENSSKEVQDAYMKALEDGKKEGYVPVLVVADDTLAEWLGILDDEEQYVKEDVIKSAVNGKQFLNERFKEYTEDYMEDFGEDDAEDIEETLAELYGEIEEAEGASLNRFMAYESYDSEDIQEVILFQIPVQNPWEVVAWVPMGGWNECPPADEMMAVAKYWYEKYGAMIGTISHDTLEFYVPQAVEDSEKAMELAKEMYGFCPDCVDQGVGTIGALYAGIRKSHMWFFWWD